MDKTANTVKIADDYSLEKQPDSLQQIFMTVCEIDLSKTGKIRLTTPGQKVAVLNYDANLWTVSIGQPSIEGAEYSSFAEKWDGRKINRIILTARNPLAKNTLKYDIKIED